MNTAKKQTFKHAGPSGKIFTRSSVRAYTHVVMCRPDNAVAMAAIESRRSKHVVDAVISAKEHWAECLLVKAAGVGGTVPYTKHQGGYGNPKGMKVTKGWYDLHVAYLTEHDTIDAYVEYCRSRAEAGIDREIATTRAGSEAAYVASWHHSYELAESGTAKYVGAGDVKYVERINNGVRDSDPKCAKCGETEHRGPVESEARGRLLEEFKRQHTQALDALIDIDAQTRELRRLRHIENMALRVASARRENAVLDKAALDNLDRALEKTS